MAVAPGASVAAVKTGVAPVRSFVTSTFVNVILPALLTVPLKVRRPPPTGGMMGQFCVTTIRGVVISTQVADAVLVASISEQASAPVAMTVLLTAQASSGAVKLATKFAEAPGARVATVKTTVFGMGRLFTTLTLFRVTFPEFLTVPV